MDGQPTLTVRGHATAPAKPDFLIVHLSVSETAATSAEALRIAGERWTRLTAILDHLHIDERKRSGSSINVNPYYEPSRDPRSGIAGWTASGQLTVQLASAETATRLVDRAAVDTDAQVSAWSWIVAPDNPAHTDAAVRAVAQARARAQALAAALGHELGALLAAGDSEPSGGRLGPRRLMAGAIQMSAGVPVQEGWADVSASVELTFALVARAAST